MSDEHKNLAEKIKLEKAPAEVGQAVDIEKAPAALEKGEEQEAGGLGEAEKKPKSASEAFTATPSAIGDWQIRNKQREKKIENVLSKGLEEAYLSMDQQKQREFKKKGEQTAREINNLLGQAKIKIKKIISLIKKWLSVIPGVNKFFIEQESKIKADEIVRLKK